jgi:hypothetical protein
MTAERAIRYLVHEAQRVRHAAYAAGTGHGPDAEILEAFLLLHPSIGQALELAPMDDAEASAVRYHLQQELIGRNGHVTTV